MSDSPNSADDLYGLPATEFVAARDALARRLREAGDREQAAAVKKLRRPSATAAALNVAARSEPDLLRNALDAIGRLREVTQGAVSGEGGDVRAAIADERAATKQFLDVAQAHLSTGGATAPERLAATLRAAALDEELAESLRRGMLSTDHHASGLDFATANDSAGPAPAKGSTAGRRRERRGEADKVAAERAARAARRRELKAEVARLRATAKQLDSAAAQAEKDARSARDEADRAHARLDQAMAELKRMT